MIFYFLAVSALLLSGCGDGRHDKSLLPSYIYERRFLVENLGIN